MLKIPGKTFLVGEYAVLVGGKALGLATKPYFTSTNDKFTPHPNSAAGLFLKDQSSNALVNPYGTGGFGQSTAEFIAAWFEKDGTNDIETMYFAYRNLFSEARPSGADLVTQMLGRVTYFNPEVSKSKSLDWPFKDLDFVILSTGLKIPTHEHLKDLDLDSLADLPAQSEQVVKSFLAEQSEDFLFQLTQWCEKLKSKRLQHNHSLQLVHELKQDKSICLAKPNGALGADTITVFYKTENQAAVYAHIKKLNLEIKADRHALGLGTHYVD